MSQLLSLGALTKVTGEYVYPKIANKKEEYICPECSKDLTLCQGKIRVPYFRHNVDSVNPCHYYSSPSETQIHKDAKILLKTLLEQKNQISFIRNCISCKKNDEYEIPEISETSSIELEYRFEYNGGVKIADVAYIDNGELVGIFEICNTHKTCSENRPEPWFEIDAETLINIANDITLTSLKIPCIRCEKCEECENTQKKYYADKNRAVQLFKSWFNGRVNENWCHPGNFGIYEPLIYIDDNIELCKSNKLCSRLREYGLYPDVVLGDQNYDLYYIYIDFIPKKYSTEVKKICYVYNDDITACHIDINWILTQKTIATIIPQIVLNGLLKEKWLPKNEEEHQALRIKYQLVR